LQLDSTPDFPVHIQKTDMYCSNIQLNVHIMVVEVKELQEITSTMPVGKASGYNHI